MVAVILVIALSIFSACRNVPDTRLAATFEQGRRAVREGQLAEARAISDRAASQLDPQSSAEWIWKFRLLAAEADLAGLDAGHAASALGSPIPDGDRFAALRGRQKYLQARTLLLKNDLSGTLLALSAATAAAPSDVDVRRDAGVLAGQVKLRLGRWAEAEQELETLVAETASAGDHYRQALALNNLGMGYLMRSRFDEALQRFEQVFKLSDIDRTTVFAAALNNSGICYARLGEFERAVDLQRRAVALHEKTGRRAEWEQALGELGSTFLLQENFDSGLPYLRQALTIATSAGLRADAALWARNLAAAYVYLEKWDEADRYNREARQLNPADRPDKLAFSTLHDGHIAAGRGHTVEATRLFEQVLAPPASEPAVQWSAHQGLARVAIAMRQPQVAVRHFEVARKVIETTRSDLLRTDSRLSFLTRLTQFYEEYVNALIDEKQIERALEVADSSRGRVLAERQSVAPPPSGRARDFVSVARQSRAVMLFYWLGNPRSHLFVVTGTGITRMPLPAAREIGGAIEAYDAAIASPAGGIDARGRAAGEELFSLLVEPARKFIPPGATVIIVPDGPLHMLNFETLTVPGAERRFWIEDVELQVAPALGALNPDRVASAGRSLLLIGNPVPRAPEFPALSYAPVEMSAIAKHFRPEEVTTYQGADASPGAYSAAAPGRFRMIHFTAHAEANAAIPLDSAVILSGPERRFKLYARDIAGAPIRADLVTVSACRSAGNRAYTGEGLVGLAWAFMRAGARRVVAGLWDVDDRSTAELMDEFYANLSRGDTPARALRAAKMKMISRGGNYAKPYYWAAFELFTASGAG